MDERSVESELPVRGLEPTESTSPGTAEPVSLTALVERWLKAGAAVYVLGFAVMLVQTSRLHVPAIEVLHFQAIVAGLPIWLVLFGGFWLSGTLVRRMVGEAESATDWRVSAGAAAVIAGTAALVYVELHALFGLRLTVANGVLFISAIVFVVSAVFLVLSFLKEYSKIRSRLSVVAPICVYSGMMLLVAIFAVFCYPRIPQSVGGGRPVQVQLLLKDEALRSLFSKRPFSKTSFSEASDSAHAPLMSDPLEVYFRTASFLLVSAGPDQPLVQVPLDEIRAMVWLGSDTP